MRGGGGASVGKFVRSSVPEGGGGSGGGGWGASSKTL